MPRIDIAGEMSLEAVELTIESTREDIAAIQMLRGVAAAMVVFVHMDLQLERLGYGPYGLGWLASGVDIFFVISGFIMWVSVEKRGGKMTAVQFMRRRIVRIAPLYWLLTGFVLTICVLAPELLRTTALDGRHAAASFLFFPARHPVLPDKFWPLLIPGWTLNFEMLFYLLFAIAIAASSGSANRRLVVIALLIVASLSAAVLLNEKIDFMRFYANPVLFEFLAGIMLGVVYLNGRPHKSWAWLLALLPGIVLLRHAGEVGLALGGTNIVPATMVVAGALFLPIASIKALETIGNASYSLYLTHVITLAGLAYVWSHGGFYHLGAPVFAVTGIALSILGSIVCYRQVELRASNGLDHLIRKYEMRATRSRS